MIIISTNCSKAHRLEKAIFVVCNQTWVGCSWEHSVPLARLCQANPSPLAVDHCVNDCVKASLIVLLQMSRLMQL